MAINFNPAITFRAKAPINPENNGISEENIQPVTQVPVTSPAKVSPVRGAFSDIAKFYVSASEMTKAVIKAGAYGFMTGTAVAAYKWMSKALPNAFKEGGSIVNTIKHPARSIGWKGNLFAGVAALGVATYHIVRGKLKANQGTANVDHQLYTGHRDI